MVSKGGGGGGRVVISQSILQVCVQCCCKWLAGRLVDEVGVCMYRGGGVSGGENFAVKKSGEIFPLAKFSRCGIQDSS